MTTRALRDMGKRASRRAIRKLAALHRSYPTLKYPSSWPAPAKAIAWVRAHENRTGGIRVHSGDVDSYPEITGYLVPTLIRCGEVGLSASLVRWLLCIQRADGSYTSPQGRSYVFDTAQVLSGLLAARELVPGSSSAARRAVDYLMSQLVDGGTQGFGERYSGEIPEAVHLFAIHPLQQAARIFRNSGYYIAAEKCVQYYLTHPGSLQIGDLTHFLAYELEALIDIGLSDRARPTLEALARLQTPDGSLRGKQRVTWVCTPGLAQLAVCWYKLGEWQVADRAMQWLDSHQRKSGGFLGSYGPGSSYFPNVELSWAMKFYLDAHMLRVSSYIQRNPQTSQIHPTENDLTHAILQQVKQNHRFLEVGFTEPTFAKLLPERDSNTDVTIPLAPDIFTMQRHDVDNESGELKSFPNNTFDFVLCGALIKHSINPHAAVAELCRVAKPGGLVIIMMDKHPFRPTSVPSWAWFPGAQEMQKLLNKSCDDVSMQEVKSRVGSIMICRARKRSRLSGSQWNEVLISESSQRALIERVRRNKLSEWAQVILLQTHPGERVLEVGSGTGEISLQLAQGGRVVTALDLSTESLHFIKLCAHDLGVEIRTMQADAMKALPFSDNEFDCTWSSGLLEHFGAEDRRAMLQEWSRISSGRVITLVPNASSLAYRAGKMFQERRGTWPYGIETPIISMRDDFEAVGLQVNSEFSVGAKHALEFLPPNDGLRRSLSAWVQDIGPLELEGWNQGYLLVTIGAKKS